MATVELLIANELSKSMWPIINSMRQTLAEDGCDVLVTNKYDGNREWLVLAGVGSPVNNLARRVQCARGGKVLHWDHGYYLREKVTGNMRMCINTDHPQHWLDKTPEDPSRWDASQIALRDDYRPDGHILLVGMGSKSRAYLNEHRWEENTLNRLRREYPKRQIIYRPKGADRKRLPIPFNAKSPIESLIQGASLVVCRHSNVAVDAVIAGVPFEATDGAAMWLASKPFTVENRLAFLRRLAWWQWRSHETAEAWAFCKRVSA